MQGNYPDLVKRKKPIITMTEKTTVETTTLNRPEQRSKKFIEACATSTKRYELRTDHHGQQRGVPLAANRQHIQTYANVLSGQPQFSYQSRSAKLNSLISTFTFLDVDAIEIVSKESYENKKAIEKLRDDARLTPILKGDINAGKHRSAKTVNGYIAAFRHWVSTVNIDDTCPEWIIKKWERVQKDVLDPINRNELLTPDESMQMIRATTDDWHRLGVVLRNRCLIALMAYEGFRPYELLNFPVKNIRIENNEYICKIVESKNRKNVGARDNPIQIATPFIKQYLAYLNEVEATPHYLACNIGKHLDTRYVEFGQLSSGRFVEIFQAAGKAAGITKSCNPSDLRKSAITFLIDSKMERVLVEQKAGHKTNSPSLQRYYPGATTEQHISFKAQQLGRATPQDAEPYDWNKLITECPTCSKDTPPEFKLCLFCDSPVDLPKLPEVPFQAAAMGVAALAGLRQPSIGGPSPIHYNTAVQNWNH